jgi:Ca2+-binding RTX toxin-like protein
VQGRIPGVGWQPDPAQVPTITADTRIDNSAPFIFRMTEENSALFPSAGQVATILANNTDANTSYAYVLNPDGTLHLVDRNSGAGDYKSLYVANNIETLNLGLSAPNAVYGGFRDTMVSGDTIMVQSAGHTVDDIVVDNLTIDATASSSDLNLTLGNGVTSLTLADYASGQGANVNVTGNGLNDTITGNSGNNILTAGSGNDTLNGGGGYDTYKLGASFGQTVINNYAADGSSPKGEIDFAAGVDHSQLWFQRSGNNLQIDLLGTNNDVTIDNWYAGNARNQVQSINAGDGSKLDSQIAQLVSAMATCSADNPSFDPTQVSQMPNDQNLQTVLAAAWH